MRPASQTFIRAMDYLEGDKVTLYLGRPNVNITLPVEEAKDPQTLHWRIRSKFGNRHQCHGRAFDDLTRGRCRTRWQELVGLAPIGINGNFHPLDGSESVGIDEVLNGTA